MFCLTKQDLWEVLAEYPSARETLFERGKAHLRKDNLLDEDQAQSAQQDQAAIPEKIIRLQENISHLEARIARLIAEYKSNMGSLDHRLQTVEQLADEKQINNIPNNQKNPLHVTNLGVSEDDV